jgi:hypothetical protein
MPEANNLVGIQSASMSESYPLHLILGESLLGSVIELGRSWALMRCHFLGMFKGPAVAKIAVMPVARML